MKNIVKSILILFLVVFISGCMEVIEIDGKTEIRTDEAHTYKVVTVSTEYDSMDSYSWKVISDHKDYNLTNETTSEITFNAHTAGQYTLEVIAKKNRKTFKATVEIEVTEPEIINGYLLPPEPDETLNNSTLLGIDSNNNGVRDDVERKIIKTYKEPIKIEPMMASVKIGQEILANPVGLAKEHSAKMDRIDNCTAYLRTAAPNLIDELAYIKFYENNMYNTKERIKAYMEYNQALSGGVYGSGPSDWTADKCDFDIETMLKDRK